MPTPTETLIPPTLSPTPTIVWFPATPSYTPYPSPELLPTDDMRPGIGELIYADGFDDAGAWSLGFSDSGSAALGRNELTIAINAVDTYMFSVRNDWVLTNFYLEITASPSMCRDMDEYGLLLRVSPAMDYYRFSLSCNGQVRLDRIYRGQPSSPQPWLMSGAVPPGAPSTSRLGVWVVGSEFRFFVNDRYEFTIRDPLLLTGGIGVFARSTDNWPVTVNFSELEIYSVTSTGE